MFSILRTQGHSYYHHLNYIPWKSISHKSHGNHVLLSRMIWSNIKTPARQPLINYQYQSTCFTNLSSSQLRTSYFIWRPYLFKSFSSHQRQSANQHTITYMIAVAIMVVGLSYAAVPLYRLFCQASGYGGTVNVVDSSQKIEQMSAVEERELTIRFNADISAGMRWKFIPQQKEIKLVPGETALAFYTAINPTDEPITGIATYNVLPFEAGQYFNKIQCFCFEEQRLNPREEVDMPVFFYIDPEFVEDPSTAKIDTITLSYMLFEAKDEDTLTLQLPQIGRT